MSEPIYKLYVVDDEASIIDNFQAYFEDCLDFDTKVFGSAEEALTAFSTDLPDICIVDMRLPGMSGSDYIVRAKAICPSCLFVVHTGSVDLTLNDELRGAGLTDKDLFFKPSDMEQIEMRIREMLTNNEGSHGHTAD